MYTHTVIEPFDAVLHAQYVSMMERFGVACVEERGKLQFRKWRGKMKIINVFLWFDESEDKHWWRRRSGYNCSMLISDGNHIISQQKHSCQIVIYQSF